MNIYNAIKFIGTKNPNYSWDKVKGKYVNIEPVEGKGYLDDKKLREGDWIEYYPDGVLKSEGTYKSGYMNGNWKFYFPNGQLASKGKMMMFDPWNDGMFHSFRVGKWEYYHENGQLKSKGSYKNGEKDGEWEWYYEDGRFCNKKTFKDGKQIE